MSAILFAACLTLGLIVSNAPGFQNRAIRSAIEQPVAPRGGVLLLPLFADQIDGDWPRSTTLTLPQANNQRLTGHIVWIAANDKQRATHWTSDPRRLGIHITSRPDDLPAARPYLLAELPADGEGPINLGQQTLNPIWRTPPALGTFGPIPQQPHGSLEAVRGPDRPDLDSPFEYWRWVLLADRLGKHPPPPAFEREVERLLARHLADLWLIGLDRVNQRSPAVAATLRDALTRLARDGERAFATWVADPTAINQLLNDLLNFRRPDEQLIDDALRWADHWNRLLLWAVNADSESLTLAVVNPAPPGEQTAVATLSWLGTDEYAMAVELEAGALSRVTMDRPKRSNPSQFRNSDFEFRVLLVSTQDHSFQIPLNHGTLTATSVQPPGLWLAAFHPPLTLAAAQTGFSPDIMPRRDTHAQLRRLGGRWELFIECRRPVRSNSKRETRNTKPEVVSDVGFRMSDFTDDAIVIILGDDEPDAVLVVPEAGWHQLMQGENDDTLRIHRSSHPDRWHARIVLPDAWLQTLPGEVTHIGMIRLHHDLDEIHTSPFPSVPWAIQPGRISVDLSGWTDFPLPADVRGQSGAPR